MTEEPTGTSPQATVAPTPGGPAAASGGPVPTPAELAPASPAADVPVPPGRMGLLRRWGWLVVGLLIVTAIVVVLAPLASPDPDGLEAVAGQQGWLAAAQDAVYGLLPGYTIPGLEGSASTVVSGLVGVGIVFLAMLGLGWMLRRRRAPRP